MRKKTVNKVLQQQRKEKADDDRGLHLPFHVASEQSGEECDNKLEKEGGGKEGRFFFVRSSSFPLPSERRMAPRLPDGKNRRGNGGR